MKVAELFAYLGIVTDEKKAKDFFNVLQGGKQVLFGLAAATIGTSLSIGAMLNKAVQTSLALAHFEAETGLSAQTLQEWQHVGEGLGLTVDEVTSSIAALNDQLAEVKLTGQGAAPYSRLGLNPLEMENAWDVLEELRKIIKSGDVPPQLMSKLIKQMGLSGAMVKVLKLTNKEFDRMANRGAIITKDQIELALKFNAAMRRIGQTLTYLFTVAFAELAPEIIGLLNELIQWIEDNKGDLIKGIKEIAAVWKELAVGFGKAFVGLDAMIKRTIGWANAIKGVLAMFVLFNPLLRTLWLIIEALKIIDFFMTKEGTFIEKMEKWRRGGGEDVLSKIAKHITAAGEMVRDVETRVIGRAMGIEPEADISGEELLKIMEDFKAAPGGGLIIPQPAPAGPGPISIRIEQNIQTVADANEVARISTEMLAKEIGRAYAT